MLWREAYKNKALHNVYKPLLCVAKVMSYANKGCI